ncbi:hypothetical protein [Asaia spathodeae]|uniref:hypothetical protein n=1 Tax=Asaia spathodeae TaxID=657016 RepID=UPI002FC364DA
MPDGLMIGGQVLRDLDPAGLSLHWPAWFAADEAELLPMAKGLGEAVNAGLLSQETAARLYACAAGVADPAAEWTKIKAARAA